MSRQRYIDTSFWSDEYIESLDPLERYLYIYFLTNPLTNIAGAYKMSVKRMAFETGIDKDMVTKMIGRFTDAQKIAHIDGYIVIKNFIKHQKVNDNIKKGIDKILSELPESVTNWLNGEGVESLSKASNYININNNINSNDNSNINDNVSKDTKPSKDPKHKHGELNNVLLTQTEYDTLITEFTDYQSKIDNLSYYIASKGAKYKSHYMTIKAWARNDKKPKPKEDFSKFHEVCGGNK